MLRNRVRPAFEYEFSNVDDLRRLVQQDLYFYDRTPKPCTIARDAFSTLYFMWNRTRYILLALIDRRFGIKRAEMEAVDKHVSYLIMMFDYYIEITAGKEPDAATSPRAIAVSESISLEARWTRVKLNRKVDNVTAFVVAAARARDNVLHAVLQDSLDRSRVQLDPEVFCRRLGEKEPLGKVLVVIYALSRRYQGCGQFFPLPRGALSVDQCLQWAQTILYPSSRKFKAKKRIAKLVQKKDTEFLGPIQMFGLQSFD